MLRLLLLLVACVVAAPAAASFEQDRADILAMAGSFHVRFDMQETTAWAKDYAPLERKVTGGEEVVRVIEDRGRHIVLQHLLVVAHGGETHVIKHWRQDWQYEPERVLAYVGPSRWQWQPVPAAERRGAWSQTVWQVDDSPRYAGWGRWETFAGLRRWTSSPTLRPLARRDAVRKPVYDRYLGVNRHQRSPDGWIHWQDNVKLAGDRAIVQETVLNSYTRGDDFAVNAADDYWSATRDFWAAVRAAWDEQAATGGGLHVRELADTGTVVAAPLLALADAVQAGTLTTVAAGAQARGLIAEETARR